MRRDGGGVAAAAAGHAWKTSGGDAPSTTLRAVPLPRFAGEDKQARPRPPDQSRLAP